MSGIFLPEPANRGFSTMRAGLVTQCFLEAMTVTQDKQSYDMVALDDKLRGKIEVRHCLVQTHTHTHTRTHTFSHTHTPLGMVHEHVYVC